MNARVMIIPLAVVVSLSFAACGDGDDDKTLAKSELAKKANEICQTAREETDGIAQPPDLFVNADAAAAYFTKIEPVLKKRTDELAKLEPADDVKADWTQFVDRQKQAYGEVVTVRDKAKANDTNGLRDLQTLGRINEKLTGEAAAVGATTCAQRASG